eukprot:2244916-Pyramimonas_sp.AAC.1
MGSEDRAASPIHRLCRHPQGRREENWVPHLGGEPGEEVRRGRHPASQQLVMAMPGASCPVPLVIALGGGED